MTDERFVVLSALIDREPVEPDEVAAALESDEGRAQLVAFVRLRARVAAEYGDSEPAASPRRTRSPARLWLARAAIVLLPLAAGSAITAWLIERQESRPPTPTRVVQFVPGVDWKPAR
jgi:hypothetical protein